MTEDKWLNWYMWTSAPAGIAHCYECEARIEIGQPAYKRLVGWYNQHAHERYVCIPCGKKFLRGVINSAQGLLEEAKSD